MTPEQKAKLEARRAALLDVLVDEADPSTWPKSDTKEGRGDRAWMKTNAIKTAALIVKIEDLVGLRGVLAGPLRPSKEHDDELEEGETAGASAGDAADVDKLIKAAGAKVKRIRDGAKKSKG